MTPSSIRGQVVQQRAAWVREMLAGLSRLPVDSESSFLEDPRTVAAAESYLRRALEALLDLGRHVLAKGFARASLEYKEIAMHLEQEGVLDSQTASLLRDMAGYRNRMVHFYDRIDEQELLQLAREGPGDILQVLDALLDWIERHPDLVHTIGEEDS